MSNSFAQLEKQISDVKQRIAWHKENSLIDPLPYHSFSEVLNKIANDHYVKLVYLERKKMRAQEILERIQSNAAGLTNETGWIISEDDRRIFIELIKNAL